VGPCFTEGRNWFSESCSKKLSCGETESWQKCWLMEDASWCYSLALGREALADQLKEKPTVGWWWPGKWGKCTGDTSTEKVSPFTKSRQAMEVV